MTVVSAARVPMFEPLRTSGVTIATLLATKDKWTKGAAWRDAAGVEITKCPIRSNPPASFDLMGAVCWAYEGKDRETALTRIMTVLGCTHFAQIWQWNDRLDRTYEEVLALVQKAGI